MSGGAANPAVSPEAIRSASEKLADPIEARRVIDRIESMGDDLHRLTQDHQALADAVGLGPGPRATMLEVFEGYLLIGIAAFFVTLIATPILRRLAIANGVVDRPDARKVHRTPIAYLGGVAVYLGVMAGLILNLLSIVVFPGLVDFHPTVHEELALLAAGPEEMPEEIRAVPMSVLLGLTVICIVGLVDDVAGISPRLKLGGQLFAAAALALDNVGVQFAAGAILPLARLLGMPTIELHGFETIGFVLDLPFTAPLLGDQLSFDLVYWIGTATIAVFVLGACNASNLIDGLDGLLSGVTAIAGIGLLIVALSLAVQDDGPRDAQRVVMCMALVGACLGFLPHNFNPATIFLGDCGSLLLGFMTITIVLMMGDTGKTHLVLAGLIIYGIPIIDTILAIVRRKMAGKKMSDPDKDHLHHMLLRNLGVRKAVLTLYGLGIVFGMIGVAMSESRARVTYAIALLFASWIMVYSIKIARKRQLEDQYENQRLSPTQNPADEPADTPVDNPADNPADNPSVPQEGAPADTRTLKPAHSD